MWDDGPQHCKKRNNHNNRPTFTATFIYQEQLTIKKYKTDTKWNWNTLGYPTLINCAEWTDYVKNPFNHFARQRDLNHTSPSTPSSRHPTRKFAPPYGIIFVSFTDCWKKRYQLSSKSSWPWVVPWRPWVNTPLKILPPAALVEGVLLRWFILCCEYCISMSKIHAQTCYHMLPVAFGKRISKLENLWEMLWNPSPISRFPSPKIRFFSPRIRFSSYEIRFTKISFLLSSTTFHFLQWLSDFLQPLSAFSNCFPNFSNGFPIFFNGFLLSKKSKKIYLWWEVYEILLFELRIFCHSLPKLRNFRWTIPTSHPTHSCGAPVYPTVRHI